MNGRTDADDRPGEQFSTALTRSVRHSSAMSHTFAERGNPGGICNRSAAAVADDCAATVMAFAQIYGNEVRAQGFHRLNAAEKEGEGGSRPRKGKTMQRGGQSVIGEQIFLQ